MKTPALFTMPWDTVVFLTITTVGFGFTVQGLRNPQSTPLAPLAIQEYASPAVAERANQPLDFGCLDSSGFKRFTVDEGAVRIKGRLCQLSQKTLQGIEGIRVRNLTNGSEGTVFLHNRDNTFVSDTIALSSGRNEVQVEWRESRARDFQTYSAYVFEK
jgi:hypothetical protein